MDAMLAQLNVPIDPDTASLAGVTESSSSSAATAASIAALGSMGALGQMPSGAAQGTSATAAASGASPASAGAEAEPEVATPRRRGLGALRKAAGAAASSLASEAKDAYYGWMPEKPIGIDGQPKEDKSVGGLLGSAWSGFKDDVRSMLPESPADVGGFEDIGATMRKSTFEAESPLNLMTGSYERQVASPLNTGAYGRRPSPKPSLKDRLTGKVKAGLALTKEAGSEVKDSTRAMFPESTADTGELEDFGRKVFLGMTDEPEDPKSKKRGGR